MELASLTDFKGEILSGELRERASSTIEMEFLSLLFLDDGKRREGLFWECGGGGVEWMIDYREEGGRKKGRKKAV